MPLPALKGWETSIQKCLSDFEICASLVRIFFLKNIFDRSVRMSVLGWSKLLQKFSSILRKFRHEEKYIF